MAIFDVIRFDGLKSKAWIIYKYPSEDIVLGSKLIVQEGQMAIFVKNGMICDLFYPGAYPLSTDNLPIIGGIVKLPYGGKTPFSAEIYFINTATMLELNWGTTDPIQLIDPKYYVKLRIRAFGQMALKIADASALFREVIGGMAKSEIIQLDKVKKYFRGLLVIKVKAAIADAIITNKISALEISPKLEELSERVKEQIKPEFEKYGFRVANFYIQSINFPDEDFEKINKILEDKAAFEIMGDRRYAAKRSFDVYEGAANNESGVAGAFAAGGIGMGAAIGIGSSMQQQVGNPMTDSNMRKCPQCGSEISKTSKFCPECGFSFKEITCSCGKVLPPGTKFCPECGKKVTT